MEKGQGRPLPWRARLAESPLPQVLAIVLGLRVALGVVGWASLAMFPVTGVGGNWLELQLSNRSWLWAFVGPWERWDALWYHHVAAAGYQKGAPDAAFFPLYPFLMRVGGEAMRGYYALSGLVVSTIAFVVALVLLHRLVRLHFDRGVADRTILYTAIAPSSFFFLAPYTESLFLALSVGCFLAMYKRLWVVAGCVAGLATLCRSTGILLMAPLLVAVGRDMWQRRREHRPLFQAGHLALLVPPVAIAGWFYETAVILQVKGGFWGAEATWANRLVAPWYALGDGWHALTTGHHPEEAYNLVYVVLFAVALVAMFRRVPWEYWAYAFFTIPVVLMREAYVTPLASAARYLTVVFPLFVFLALLARRQWLHRALTVSMLPLMTLLFMFYVHYGFAG